MSLPAGLPAPVARWLSGLDEWAAGELEAEGSGSIRQPVLGRAGAWLPLTWRLRLRPTRLFHWEAAIRVLRVRTVHLREEYVSSRGRLTVGDRTYEDEQIDRSQYSLLWAWSLCLAPHAALRRSGVTWEPDGSAGARIVFPYGSEFLEARLAFDVESGMLRRFETRRFELRAGYPRVWTADLPGFREIGGISVPASMEVAWDEDAALRLRLEEMTFDGQPPASPG